ncbi:MAG: 30S ribosomal protein S8 [Gammaproteobacteria bacterium]|nr:30S ribosomal protein S8 [Gammaproteobacteria bacterium]MDE0226830.1 30S ribosomal protein S8 [Gammaproteobacteria bacterium]MDE0450566.1 30S ribosomal protein S8 [Gammaproteobacteria bacterium]
MSMQDPIADFLTRIRNAQSKERVDVTMPSSKLKVAICEVLRDEGYVGGYRVSEGPKPELTVDLKYHDGAPVIEELKRVSRPGLRVYKQCNDIREERGGLAIAIISTAQGVMTDRAARKAGIGGEVLCTVF